MSKRRLVVGNWKMYITSPEEAKKFVSTLRKKSRVFSGVDVVIAPPFPLLPAVLEKLKGSTIKVGAQSVSAYDDAKRTGEVSALMVEDLGAKYAIIGHSERRAMGEDEEIIGKQLQQALGAGLTPILCIGEKERDAAGGHFSIITEQLTSALKVFAKQKTLRLVVAYEPVWAIGKSAGDAMKPADLREMSIFIKKTLADSFDRATALRVPIIYGGSVEPDNARALMAEGDINGFLVGHASSEFGEFVEILKSVR
jgi:triosephosphate isomerase